MSADNRTLRLAAPPLTADMVDRYLAYLERASGPADHVAALEGSRLSAQEYAWVRPLVDDLCGRLWTADKLEQRMNDPRPTRTSREEIAGEVARLRDLTPLVDRYGAENVSLLVAREPRLMALHRRGRV